jgi:hypothetical protein
VTSRDTKQPQIGLVLIWSRNRVFNCSCKYPFRLSAQFRRRRVARFFLVQNTKTVKHMPNHH